MTKNKTKTKTKAKSTNTKPKAKKPAVVAKKVEKPTKKLAAPIPVKIVAPKPEKKEKEAKKAAPLFSGEPGFAEDSVEDTTSVAPDPFLSDDFDTSRKELEEGYLEEDEEEDDESADDDDLYGDDETASFESYDDDDLDYDEDDDDYGSGKIAEPGTKKKKKYSGFEEE